ncbi:MAG: hypothetical protein KatS3mg109_0287 [Pirellulaceae bacterium]|nr:MAG: hypothetical protein KatS3mg109_0287 [Pirellulaceae bacterium]
MRTEPKREHIVVAGCGTVGLAVARAIAQGQSVLRCRKMTFIDGDVIRPHNAITCPEYTNRQGEPKALTLAELVRHWSGRSIDCQALCCRVEDVDWLEIAGSANRSALPVVVMALDDWSSRLALVHDVRSFVQRVRNDDRAGRDESDWLVPVLQVSVERHQAQVSVFGSSWDDPCPACGLGNLPVTEPCVVFDTEGRSIRGTLHEEAKAAARLVMDLLCVLCSGQLAAHSVNVKCNLWAETSSVGGFARVCRAKTRVVTCLGPHHPAGPQRAITLLETQALMLSEE